MAFDAGAVVGRLSLDISNWKDNIDKAKRDTKSLEGLLISNASALHKVGLALSGVGLALTGVSTMFVKNAMEVEESENLFNVTMQSMSDSVRTWSNTLSDALGMNRYEMRKNIGVFTTMIRSMGFTTEQAANMSKAIAQLGYDMSSFYNVTADDAFMRIRAGIAGETEPLKRLGIIVNETAIKTWALNHGIVKQGQEMTEIQKVWSRYNIILESTTSAQGDLARTWTSLTNLTRAFGSKMIELSATLGSSFLPILSRLFVGFNQNISSIIKFVEAHKSLVSSMVIGIGVFGLLSTVLGALALVLPGLATAAVALNVSLITLVGGLATSLALVAAAVTAVVYAIQNLDMVKAFMWSIAVVVNQAMAKVVDSMIAVASASLKLIGIFNPLIKMTIPALVEGLKSLSTELKANADYAQSQTNKSYQNQLQSHTSMTNSIKANMMSTSQEFKKFIDEMNTGIGEFVVGSTNSLNEWRADIKRSFDFSLSAAQSTFGSITSSFSSLFSDAFKGQLKSAKEYFKDFMTSILDGMAQILAQWVAIQIMSSAFGISTAPAGAATTAATTGYAEGTPYVPSTGLYKLHAGEKVTPRYNASRDESGGQQIVIHNLITNEAVATAMKSKEGQNVIVNVIDNSSLQNGTIRKTIGRK